ncbi:MAG: tetratricopeptide repeat protein, partial [Pseudomonadota bacterium]
KYRKYFYVQYGLGILAIYNGEYDSAISFLEKVINSSPDFIYAHYNLGIAYKKLLNLPEMVRAFKQVIFIGKPTDDLVKITQDILDDFEQMTQDNDDIDLDTYLKGHDAFDQGFRQMELGNWADAITLFHTSINIASNHTQSYGNLGICYANLGQKQQALEMLDKAIELNSNYEPAIFNRQVISSLEEGESLNSDFRSIEYYKEYPGNKRSFIKELMQSSELLLEKQK